jgi:Ca2+-binding RTX toxin-like protein
VTGGEGRDVLTLFDILGDDAVAQITDFDRSQDSLRVWIDVGAGDAGPLTLRDWADGTGADLFYGDDLVAEIGGAQGMDPAMIDLFVRGGADAGPINLFDGPGSNTLLGNGSNSTLSGGVGDDVITVGGATLVPGAALSVQVWADGRGADVLAGAEVIARVTGGQGLAVAYIGVVRR